MSPWGERARDILTPDTVAANHRLHMADVRRDQEEADVNIRNLPDFDKRMDAARRRAQWELGDASWAGLIIGAFLDPDAEKGENR